MPKGNKPIHDMREKNIDISVWKNEAKESGNEYFSFSVRKGWTVEDNTQKDKAGNPAKIWKNKSFTVFENELRSLKKVVDESIKWLDAQKETEE